MTSLCLLCMEVAISQRIFLQESKNASNHPCERFIGSLVTGTLSFSGIIRESFCRDCGTALEHVCQAVDCPGRHARRPDQDGVEVPSMRGETGYSLCVMRQRKVVGCC